MLKNYNLPIDNKILLEINDLYVNVKREDKEIFWGDSCASAYEFSINNIQFKGRRDISKRWENIENLNFSGKRILDVGSNIGIFGIFLLYFSNAEKIIIPKNWFGVEGPKDFKIEELALNNKYLIV